MPAGGSDLQCALGRGLPLHIGQVRAIGGRGRRRGLQPLPAAVVRAIIVRRGHGHELAHHVQQVVRAVDLGARHQRSFFGAAGGKHRAHWLRQRAQRQAGRQGAAHRAQQARQR